MSSENHQIDAVQAGEPEEPKSGALDAFRQIRLQIDDGRTPLTFPMARLVEYLADFVTLIGSKDNAHLLAVEDGSTMPCVWIPSDIEREVQERIRHAKAQVGPTDANRAYRVINERLEADNGVGAVLDSTKAKIIEFPGKSREKLDVIGPFRELAEIDGEIERVGGKDETVPVWVKRRDGIVFHCVTTRAIAKALAQHMYEPMRVAGYATRERDDKGEWQLRKFTIQSYEQLSNDDLLTVVGRLREIEGDWGESADLYTELQHLRNGEGRPV